MEEDAVFPQRDTRSESTGRDFFAEQSYVGTVRDEEAGEIVGMYILHPNNVGRCGHILCRKKRKARSAYRRISRERLHEAGKKSGFPCAVIQCGRAIQYSGTEIVS